MFAKLFAIAFFFLSLGLGKRAIELSKLGNSESKEGLVSGRGYLSDDLLTLMLLGVGAAYTAIVLILIYGLIAEQTIFANNWSIIAVTGLLFYWQARFWILVQRKKVDDDPVKFAMSDFTSLVVFAFVALIVAFVQIIN